MHDNVVHSLEGVHVYLRPRSTKQQQSSTDGVIDAEGTAEARTLLNPKDVAAQTRILFDASPWAIVGMTIVGMTATSKRDKA
jgi:hypothetical protein